MVIKRIALICLLISMCSFTYADQKDNSLSFSGLFNMIKGGFKTEALGDDQPDIYDDLDQYITMFFKGAGIIPMIDNTTDCINATRDLAKTIDQSVQNMIANGINLDSYLSATVAIGQAQPTIKTCYSPGFDGYKQAANHFSHFSSPKTFFTKMGLKVAFSFFDWYTLYYSFDGAIAKNDTSKILFVAGQFVHTLFDFDESLNGTVSLKSSQNNLEASYLDFTYDIVYNFLNGALILDSTKIEDCESNATAFAGNFDYALTEFKKHTEESTKNGIFAIADIFGGFNDVNTICLGGVDAAWDRVQEYLKILDTPLEIIYNVVWNYRKVYKYLMQTVECTFTMDAKCIGFQGGNLFYQVFAKHS
jgi:hypothetical protein